jgi:hypothetical protein
MSSFRAGKKNLGPPIFVLGILPQGDLSADLDGVDAQAPKGFHVEAPDKRSDTLDTERALDPGSATLQRGLLAGRSLAPPRGGGGQATVSATGTSVSVVPLSTREESSSLEHDRNLRAGGTATGSTVLEEHGACRPC